ncbi:unnamed protein product [Ceutorhynchus assimilis]|uniref:Uncharacterized protein n=1 Tax=Ceutorhynchus assimilis TaxID=467358 RepID=A0A9N9MYE9_9CUCU|nr:unnamed protein product [Ceutorhynchus assimilis]
MRKTTEKLSNYTFEDLDKDLIQLNEEMVASNINIHDRLEIIKPLTSLIPTKYSFRKISIILMISIISILIIRHHQERLHWHLTAITRIIMIKFLPYFDWRYLKDEVCLIPKQKPLLIDQGVFDCDLCESLRDFEYFPLSPHLSDLSDYIQRAIDVEKPLVINGGIEHWIKTTPEDFIGQIIDKDAFARSIPCNLFTNVYNSKKGDIDLLSLFEKRKYFDNFFMHFQNCDLEAMKVFRNFTYRPSILPDELSPVTYNWLIWNKNYNAPNYKRLNLIEKTTVVGQLFGNTRLRLVPRKNCENVCEVLKGILPAGHFLIVTSLWDLEYLAEGDGENMAAVLEIKG